MDQFVEISFDCLPLRTVGRLDIPLDASPAFRARGERIKAALEKHGAHNTYYLYKAECLFRLTNDPSRGMIQFSFEGTLLTDADDKASASCDLDVRLEKENCDWLAEPVVQWFTTTVCEAVLVEFNHYIAAGDLAKAKERIEKIQAASDESGGYLGMYL